MKETCPLEIICQDSWKDYTLKGWECPMKKLDPRIIELMGADILINWEYARNKAMKDNRKREPK